MGWFSNLVEGVAKYNPYTLAAKGAWTIADTALGYATDGAWDRMLDRFTGKTEQERYQRQLALQHEQWSREDTATQRRAADLKAAGLSPVLAAGSAASSSGPISVGRPDAASPSEVAQMVMNLITQKRNVDMSYVQENLIKEQLQNVQMDTSKKLAEIQKVNAETGNQYLDYATNSYELALGKQGGTSVKHPSIPGGITRDVTEMLKKASEGTQEVADKIMFRLLGPPSRIDKDGNKIYER